MRPRYDELADTAPHIPGCAWEVWGHGDEVGTFNDVTDEHALRASRLVERGAVFSLNWRIDLPDPGLFGRQLVRQVVKDDGFGMDEYWDGFVPQSSSQWDALSHFSHPEHGYYGGRTSAQLQRPDPLNGIDHLARRGIVTRFVLADVARWRAAQGRPVDPGTNEAITVEELTATLDSQGVQVEPGDVLVIRFGWIDWYQSLDVADRRALGDDPWGMRAIGLAPGVEMVRWLWDSGAVAVAADCPSLEVAPFPPRGENLHSNLIALLGMPIGEMWDLEALAADCAADGRWTGLLTSAPLNYPGGLGSPANALAIK